MRTLKFAIVLVLLMGLLIGPAAAQQTQQDPDECRTLVRRALIQLGTNCANLDRQTVCYGHQVSDVDFLDGSILEEPGDRAGILEFEDIETVNLDTEEEEWGLSIVNSQASFPQTIRDTVRIINIGDVRLENGVFPEDALILTEDAVNVQIAGESARLFDVPADFDATPEMVGEINNRRQLQADAISETGEWVRVTFDYDTLYGTIPTAWISRDALEDEPDLDSLPVITEDSHTPMQKFYFFTGSGAPVCDAEPPSVLMVHGSSQYESRIVANDSEIAFTGTILLWAFPGSEFMRLTTVAGLARWFPDTAQQVVVPAGYSSTVCIEGPFDEGVDGNENDYIVGATCPPQLEGEIGQGLLESLTSLANIPPNILNNPIQLPEYVCASGIGGPVCEWRFPGQGNSQQVLAGLCEAGILPDTVCDRLLP